MADGVTTRAMKTRLLDEAFHYDALAATADRIAKAQGFDSRNPPKWPVDRLESENRRDHHKAVEKCRLRFRGRGACPLPRRRRMTRCCRAWMVIACNGRTSEPPLLPVPGLPEDPAGATPDDIGATALALIGNAQFNRRRESGFRDRWQDHPISRGGRTGRRGCTTRHR
jgi:hypothetical protein